MPNLPLARTPTDVTLPEEAIFSGAEIKAMGGKPPNLVDGPKKPDVKELHKRGIQGEMSFSGYVGADGKMHDVKIVKSSRSPELDAVGLGLVNASVFSPATDANGKPIAARVNFPVFLWKDSMMDPGFGKKSCGDFVADADWHNSAFPEEKPDKLRGWLLVQGMMFAGNHTNPAIPKKTRSFEDTYAICKEHPDQKFFTVMLGK